MHFLKFFTLLIRFFINEKTQLIIFDEIMHIVDDSKIDGFIKAELLTDWRIFQYVFYSFNYFDLENNEILYFAALKVINYTLINNFYFCNKYFFNLFQGFNNDRILHSYSKKIILYNKILMVIFCPKS